jgi:release factor glutamine methyltransferase
MLGFMQNVASRRAETVASAIAKATIARLDAEVLLARALGKDRTWLVAHDDEAIPRSELEQFQRLVRRRKSSEPIATITGEKEFYGRMFRVSPRVLIPRPSTETLIDETKRIFRTPESQVLNFNVIKADTGIVVVTELKSQYAACSTQYAIVDVGTGSGCIAVTLALELPDATIIASDISAEALEIACENAASYCVLNRISFVQESFIPATNKRINEQTFLLVSNPPYLPSTRGIGLGTGHRREGRDEDSSTLFEPREALFAGPDGLDVLRPLVQQAREHPRCIGFVIECLEEQIPKIARE